MSREGSSRKKICIEICFYRSNAVEQKVKNKDENTDVFA
jgi:hypothetical protein